MRVIISSLAVPFLALALLFTGSAGAQAQTFSFVVCNHNNVSASVAISNLVGVGDGRFEVQGWWTVPAGACSTIGTFPQGWFYFYAEQTNSGEINWPGDFPLCVQYPGPFTVIHTTGITCDGSLLKQFTQRQISETTGTFTWTLN